MLVQVMGVVNVVLVMGDGSYSGNDDGEGGYRVRVVGRGGGGDGRTDRGSSCRASHIGGGSGSVAEIVGGCDGKNRDDIVEMEAEVVKLASEKMEVEVVVMLGWQW